MKIGGKLALSAVGLAASISASLAGPCSPEIDAIMARINAALEARAGAGAGAKEHSTVGGRHIQPTPRSMATAEEKLGEMSADTIEQVNQAMMRARAADRAGDNVACQQELEVARRAIGP
jgi:mRNA-degrading endonuclease toxin of MazEF toxin-antitoxin module